MKVVLIYRKRRLGGHSIEELFHAIAGELGKRAEVIEYEAGSRWKVLLDAWQLRRLRADRYHVTGDIHYMVLMLPRRKTVLTVHDICHYTKQIQGIKRWLFKWIWLILPIRAASAVTTISEETRRSIKTDLGVANKDIVVIPNCVNPIFRPVSQPFNQTRPVVLQVGTNPNKNILRVIEALKGIPCKLSIIGQITADITEKLQDSGVPYENYVNLGLAELVQQYAAADVVCFASLYEGFGMPIIEANAVGRPVITSALEPMKSVAGGSACLINPLDVTSIRSGLLSVMQDPLYRDDLIEKGLRNAERYSVAVTASQYWLAYKGLA